MISDWNTSRILRICGERWTTLISKCETCSKTAREAIKQYHLMTGAKIATIRMVCRLVNALIASLRRLLTQSLLKTCVHTLRSAKLWQVCTHSKSTLVAFTAIMIQFHPWWVVLKRLISEAEAYSKVKRSRVKCSTPNSLRSWWKTNRQTVVMSSNRNACSVCASFLLNAKISDSTLRQQLHLECRRKTSSSYQARSSKRNSAESAKDTVKNKSLK